MIALLTDENFDGKTLRGLLRRLPLLDIVRVQDVELAGAPDPDILQWAAQEERVVLTHDVATFSALAWQRIGAGMSMPGVVEVRRTLSVGQAIEELVLFLETLLPNELQNSVRYLPL